MNKFCIKKKYFFTILLLLFFFITSAIALNSNLTKRQTLQSNASARKTINCSNIASCENVDKQEIKAKYKVLNKQQCNMTCEEIGIRANNNPANIYRKCYDNVNSEINCIYKGIKSDYPSFNSNNTFLTTTLNNTVFDLVQDIPYCKSSNSFLSFAYSDSSNWFDFFENGKLLKGSEIEFYTGVNEKFKLKSNSVFYKKLGDEINCEVFGNSIAYSCWDAHYSEQKKTIVYTRVCNTSLTSRYADNSHNPTNNQVFINEIKNLRLNQTGISLSQIITCDDYKRVIGTNKDFSCSNLRNLNMNPLIPNINEESSLFEKAQTDCNKNTTYQGVACAINNNLSSSDVFEYKCCDMSPYFELFE